MLSLAPGLRGMRPEAAEVRIVRRLAATEVCIVRRPAAAEVRIDRRPEAAGVHIVLRPDVAGDRVVRSPLSGARRGMALCRPKRSVKQISCLSGTFLRKTCRIMPCCSAAGYLILRGETRVGYYQVTYKRGMV